MADYFGLHAFLVLFVLLPVLVTVFFKEEKL